MKQKCLDGNWSLDDVMQFEDGKQRLGDKTALGAAADAASTMKQSF
jgi:hypothetical protein